MPWSASNRWGIALPERGLGRAGYLVLLTTLYVIAGKAGLALAYVHPSASAVWPPTGIALAAFLLLGRGVWPAILAGAFIVNLATAGNAATSTFIAIGNTLEGLVGAALVSRFAGGTRAFERVANIIRYVILAALASTSISATIGVATLVTFGLAPSSAIVPIWFTWWLGDATAAVILLPALVLAAVEPGLTWTMRRVAEAAALAACVVLAGFFVFYGVLPQAKLVASVPFPLWAAFRFGRRETAICVCVLAGFALWGTMLGLGPFAYSSPAESLLLLQAYMGALSVMMLTIAAVVAEGQRVERELRAVGDDLETTVAARTESLSEAVRALEMEVIERRRVENERRQVEQRIRRLNAELERRVQERTAALERSNEALRQFAYAASHDLREPARTMRTYAELLVRRYRGRLDADADEFLGFIVEGADWMHQLLKGLLEYARVEIAESTASEIRMDAALDQALGNLGAAIAETGARISRDPLPAIVGNDLQVVQLFQNLVGNSIKFRRPATSPVVHVSAAARGEYWLFGVEDNGIGIDPRHSERVFAIFQRLHLRQEYPGAGMGLAICRKIVELHGGRIWVESREQGGAVLRFTFPREPEVAA